jgi:hypothetical protein
VSEKKRAGVGDADPLYLKTTTNSISDTPLKLPTQARRRSARIVRGERNELAVFDGRDCCGFIRPSGDGFLLLTADRRTIGIFRSLAEALAALGGAS